MFRDPCETRVFGDPCVGREAERLVCYRNRVLLAPRVYSVCESV